MRIDAHQHYWRIARGDYGWITPELPVLYRDFGPDDLRPHLLQHKLDGSIVVQAAPTIAETEFLLALSETSDTIKGVVGWLDLDDPDWQAQYDRLNKHPKFIGIRIMIQEMQNASDILQPHYIEALQWFAAQDVPVDLLVRSDQLQPLIALLDRVPNLRGVLDHLGKPQIAEGVLEPWTSQLSQIAKHSNIYCKLSGMVTEANHQSWQPEQMEPYIHHVLKEFGPERVMFGSDWPVCLLAGSYDQVVNVLEHGLPSGLSENDKARIFGLNALAFYKL